MNNYIVTFEYRVMVTAFAILAMFSEALLEFIVQISGLKMKAEFMKIFKIFEELEEAGECATLTISSRKGISSIKLLLESPSPCLQLLQRQQPCHQLLEGVAVTAVQLQGPGADRGLLTTKPPCWRRLLLFLLLLLQE